MNSVETALAISELLVGEGNADVDAVRTVQQMLEQYADDVKKHAVIGDIEFIEDVKRRAAETLFDGKPSLPLTRGEFIELFTSGMVDLFTGKGGTMFLFMGVPISRRRLDG